ncbi:MAG: hypothetical protein JWM89_609 [Acidimicrobiales bacterium]|nr:hypothetical protein [Acidimicrobiales bacterium]
MAGGGSDHDAEDQVPFEDMVAALLKVDPEGITGQKAKPKADSSDEADEADA